MVRDRSLNFLLPLLTGRRRDEYEGARMNSSSTVAEAAVLGGTLPQHVNIETVNFCNARCPFCPLFQGPNQLDRSIRPAHVMSDDLYLEIVRQIASWRPAPTLTLNMDGEPLLDPRFAQRLEILARAGLSARAHIQTNGQFLDDERSRAILQAPLGQVHYAFDGATKETYEKHRVRCEYERVLENLRRFVAIRRELGARTEVLVKYTRTDQNAGEVAACYALLNAFMDPELDKFIDTITHSWGQESLEDGTLYNVAKAKPTLFRGGGCGLVNTTLVVLADGRVPACCLDYNFFVRRDGLGSAQRNTLQEIWQGDAFAQLRRDLSQAAQHAIPDLCRRCINLYDAPAEYPPPMIADERNLLWRSPYNYAYRFGA